MVEVALRDSLNGGLMTARLIGGRRWECPSDPDSERLLNTMMKHGAGGPVIVDRAKRVIEYFDTLPSPPPRLRGYIIRTDFKPSGLPAGTVV